MAIALNTLSTGHETLPEGKALLLLTASFILLVVQPVLETVALFLTRPGPHTLAEQKQRVEQMVRWIRLRQAEPDDGGFNVVLPHENRPPDS